VTVISATQGATVLRNLVKPNERVVKQRNYTFKRGATVVLKETVTHFSAAPATLQPSSTSMMDLTA